MSLDKYLEDVQQRRIANAKQFVELDPYLCILCHAYGSDKRSLRINCSYALEEAVPEILDLFYVPDESGYYLLIWKTCRAELLRHLQEWRNERVALRNVPKDHDGFIEPEDPDADIPVRVNGAVVMMTLEQYEEYNRSR